MLKDSLPKAIIHLMTKARMKSDAFKAELDAMEELNEKHKIQNIIFYKWDKIEYIDLISKLEKFWIITQNYANKADLVEKVADFASEYKIIFVYTGLEFLIKMANNVKKKLGRPISGEPNLFRDKFLQRDLLQKNSNDLWIKFLKWEPANLDIKEIEEKVSYPFIMKPVDWVSSSWVKKIKNRKEFNNYIENYNVFHDRLKARWVDNKELIVEEYIDWQLYTLDYFVDDEGFIYLSKPAKEVLWIDIGMDDYCVIARMSSLQVEYELKWKRLKTFVKSTVKACNIRNTFVHHEFKLTSKWKLKTIELNWRAGWWRVALMKKAYDMNLFEMIINPNIKAWKLKENNIVVIIYAPKRWILKAFNNKVLANIKRRESVYDIKLTETYLWKEVWPTRDWFTQIWTIKMSNVDDKQILKDFNYIKSKYKSLLIIDSFVLKDKKENILDKLKNYLYN